MSRIRSRRLSTASAMCLVSVVISSVSPAASLAVDPCQVVTIAEIEQVIGKVKGPPIKEGEGGMCSYAFANGKDDFSVAVFPASGMDFERKRSKKPIPIKGLGDDAFMDRGMHDIEYVNLYIKKQNATVELSIKETADDEDKLLTLGKKAVGRF